MSKILISLFDHSGNQSRPYRENGWEVVQIDIKHGQDVMDFNPAKFLSDYQHRPMAYHLPEILIIAPIPCTCYALSGNRHKKARLLSGEFAKAQELVEKTRQIIEWFDKAGCLLGWQVENPSSDIHKHNTWLGPVRQKFNPCDFAGYAPDPEQDRYNKQTWLWGDFNLMIPKRLEPLTKDNPGWRKLGGKSERTKELRSITPLGFAYAFYAANH